MSKFDGTYTYRFTFVIIDDDGHARVVTVVADHPRDAMNRLISMGKLHNDERFTVSAERL